MTATKFAIDPTHSSVDFSVRHLMISKVRGSFTKVGGAITLGDGNVPLEVDAEIDTASIDTREPQRDGHLKSPDFLSVEEFPTIVFKGTDVKPTGNETFELTGHLTIHGVTKPITLRGEVDGRTTDPWGNDRIAFSATGRLNRKDFGMSWNQALETGGIMVGEDIDLALSIQAVAAK